MVGKTVAYKFLSLMACKRPMNRFEIPAPLESAYVDLPLHHDEACAAAVVVMMECFGILDDMHIYPPDMAEALAALYGGRVVKRQEQVAFPEDRCLDLDWIWNRHMAFARSRAGKRMRRQVGEKTLKETVSALIQQEIGWRCGSGSHGAETIGLKPKTQGDGSAG